MRRTFRSLARAAIFCAAGFAVGPLSGASEKPVPPAAASAKESVNQFLNDLLPIAWQKRPKLHYHVYTEMTEEGRKWREPTKDHPVYYAASPARLVQTGFSQMAGERPPPAAEMEETLKKALAENYFLPTANPEVRPDIVIIITYGSHGNLLAEPPFAEELIQMLLEPRNRPLLLDVIERTHFVAGAKFAEELVESLRWMPPPNPWEPGSAFDMFLHKGGTDRNAQILNLAFHTCYFVVATAYDFRGVEKKQRIPLWQTRMAVSPQGVTMDEVLKPLIVNTGAFLGRETPESEIAFKRFDREGRVEVGEATVVKERTPPAAPAAGKGEP